MKTEDENNEFHRRVAPRHLSEKTRKWWRFVSGEFELDESQIRLLTMAGECWDISRKAFDVIERDGLTFLDRFKQPRERPEFGTYKVAVNQFSALMKQLGLDLPPEDPCARG